jgi:hypothetical protein
VTKKGKEKEQRKKRRKERDRCSKELQCKNAKVRLISTYG